MFAPIRTWHVLVGPLTDRCRHDNAGRVARQCLSRWSFTFPMFPADPSAPPQQLFFVLFCGMPILLMLFAAAGVRSPNATSWVAFVSAILGWLLTWYGLTFVWVNTFGS